MNKVPVCLQKIHVRSAPGLPKGLEPLEGFVAGINVIYGPNGSGKSTTLRLMQAAFSPKEMELRREQDWVEAEFSFGGESGCVQLRDREGITREGSHPTVGGNLSRDARFRLKELLEAAEAGTYGRQFNEEAAGGVDLRQVATRLGLGQRNLLSRSARQDLARLHGELHQTEGKLAKLDEARTRLEELSREQTKLRSEAARVALVQEASQHRERQTAWETVHQRLQGFPPRLEALRGDEAETLAHNREAFTAARAAWQAARADWPEALRQRRASGLTQPLPAGLLRQLEEHQVALDHLERELATAETTLAGAREARRLATEQLGGTPGEETLRRADSAFLRRMEEFCDRVEDWQGRAAALAELEGDLGDLTTTAPGSSANHAQALREWIAADRAEETARHGRKTFLLVALVFVIIGLLSGFFWHPAGFFGVVAALVLGWIWWLHRPRQAETLRREVEEKHSVLPESWTRPAVHQLVEKLELEHARELEREQRRIRWAADLTRRRSLLEESKQQLEAERVQLSNWAGFAPALGPKAFGLLAAAVRAWQAADLDQAEAEGRCHELKTAQHARQEEAKGILQTVQGSVEGSAISAANLAGWIAHLREQQEQFQAAQQRIKHIRTACRHAAEKIRTAQKAMAEVWRRVGLDDADETALHDLLRQLPDYRSLRDEVKSRERSAAEAAAFFSAHPDLDLPAGELAEALLELGQPAESLEAVNQEIGAIREQLRAARQSTAWEKKRAALENRRAALRAEREQRLADLAGALLAEDVQNQVAAESVPEVQERAGELLRIFTCGACTLHIHEGVVHARQSAAGDRLFALEELSDGTRAQLLMAVRLAFVEHGEQGWQMPLFFDEALANTDDERGRAIMRALVGIAGTGRQIFCFTSQGAEFHRWKQLMAKVETQVPWQEFPLRPSLAPADAPLASLLLDPPPRYPRPEPGESLHSYGQRIGLPAKLDLWLATMDEIPLCFLLKQPEDLHRLLECGFAVWGPLARLGAGECGLAEGERAFAQAESRARFLHHACLLWQSGRGKPLTRKILAAAGLTNTAQSPRLEDAWQAALACGREASPFLHALEASKVKITGVGAQKIATLRAFFEDQGLLPAQAPLEASELRLRLQNFGMEIGLPSDEMEELLQFVTESPP